jgi:tetratricopeptide (TPR) repeat protein
MPVEAVASLFERVLGVAQRLGRRPREIHDLRRWLIAISVAADDAVYWRVAPAWLAQLERDSGLTFWRQMQDVQASGERLKRALEQAAEQHASTPEAERVYRPDEAIKLLVYYVVMSIPVGARTLDAALIASLAPLLEPFAPLSPLVEAMWQNAICTFEANFAALRERARLRATDILARLEKISDSELRYVQSIRNALAYCVGAIEAGLGLLSAVSWAELLDRDPLQRVNAMQIRQVVRLQQGDPEGAERFRKQAEVLAVQARARQMFTNMASVELGAYAAAHDLTGVKQAAAAIEVLAARFEGWIPVSHLAQGHFERLRGNPEAALSAYERCLALSSPDPQKPWASIASWPRAIAGYIEVLIELGRFEDAKLQGERALTIGRERGLAVALHDIARALALVEAKLGDYTSATARLSEVIAQQLELGVSGLNLGASYEARARIAIWAGDTAAVEEYAALTAREYRHGRGSPLGALYERLMAEARQAGVPVLPQLSEFESTVMAKTVLAHRLSVPVQVSQSMRSAESMGHRAVRALHLICDARGAHAGHLYLLAEGGLALAASNCDKQPDAGLLEFVTEFLTRELDEPEMETVPEAETALKSSSRSSLWTDPYGSVYEPLLLTCVVDGIALCAGVAVLLDDGPRERHGKAAEVVSAVGAQLIASGDTRALPARH